MGDFLKTIMSGTPSRLQGLPLFGTGEPEPDSLASMEHESSSSNDLTSTPAPPEDRSQSPGPGAAQTSAKAQSRRRGVWSKGSSRQTTARRREQSLFPADHMEDDEPVIRAPSVPEETGEGLFGLPELSESSVDGFSDLGHLKRDTTSFHDRNAAPEVPRRQTRAEHDAAAGGGSSSERTPGGLGNSAFDRMSRMDIPMTTGELDLIQGFQVSTAQIADNLAQIWR